MANEQRTRRGGAPAPSCPKYGSTMKDVVTIAPVAGDPGLVAYECPDCKHLTSVIVLTRSNGRNGLP